MKRVVVPELLDGDEGTTQEVQDSLADLRMFNSAFGGVTTMTPLLRRVARQSGLTSLSLLDVAGASGDVAIGVHDALAGDGITVEATIMDRAASHLTATNEASAVCGSAFQLPFADASFDVVGCSLFLHHLEPPEIKTFLAEATRVSRHAVVINDLRRTRLHWLAAKAGVLIYRSRITRHDAPASVRRAYTVSELREVLASSGYPDAEFSHHYFYRMGIVIWRKDSH